MKLLSVSGQLSTYLGNIRVKSASTQLDIQKKAIIFSLKLVSVDAAFQSDRKAYFLDNEIHKSTASPLF